MESAQKGCDGMGHMDDVRMDREPGNGIKEKIRKVFSSRRFGKIHRDGRKDIGYENRRAYWRSG